ncbi:MAG: DUF2062 domain-containing protein [Betaproteobacteria bacterium]|nr:DUF2062 domain-containing protein [Betaproteobacteria bacterium]
MPRKFFRKYLPTSESVRDHKVLGRFGAWLHHPNLWHLNRGSVSGGVAVGMFAGLVPGPLQMLTAALLAIPLRVNLPVALLTTLYTNPFTIVPLYLIAYQFGRLLGGGEHPAAQIDPFEMEWSDLFGSLVSLWDWTLMLGKPLAIGLVALALTLAAAGWIAVQIGWRAYVVLAWRARRRRRAAR